METDRGIGGYLQLHLELRGVLAVVHVGRDGDLGRERGPQAGRIVEVGAGEGQFQGLAALHAKRECRGNGRRLRGHNDRRHLGLGLEGAFLKAQTGQAGQQERQREESAGTSHDAGPWEGNRRRKVDDTRFSCRGEGFSRKKARVRHGRAGMRRTRFATNRLIYPGPDRARGGLNGVGRTEWVVGTRKIPESARAGAKIPPESSA